MPNKITWRISPKIAPKDNGLDSPCSTKCIVQHIYPMRLIHVLKAATLAAGHLF